jgi:hypothetical protein
VLWLRPSSRRRWGRIRIEGIVAEIDASERNRRVRIDVRVIEQLSPEQSA